MDRSLRKLCSLSVFPDGFAKALEAIGMVSVELILATGSHGGEQFSNYIFDLAPFMLQHLLDDASGRILTALADFADQLSLLWIFIEASKETIL